jgi:DNA-binding MarR family transcriptional regulator
MPIWITVVSGERVSSSGQKYSFQLAMKSRMASAASGARRLPRAGGTRRSGFWLTWKLHAYSFLVTHCSKDCAMPSISGLEDHLGYWMRMVSNAVSQSFARRVEAEGVTVAEWVFLRALHDGEGCAPTQLARQMGMTKGAISKLADRLEAKALVTRRADRADGRSFTLSLSARGRSLVPRLARLADANDAAFFAGLSAAERRQFEALLRKLAKAHALTASPTE